MTIVTRTRYAACCAWADTQLRMDPARGVLVLHAVLAFFFFNDTAPPEISPLPLPDALPICSHAVTVLVTGTPGSLYLIPDLMLYFNVQLLLQVIQYIIRKQDIIAFFKLIVR